MIGQTIEVPARVPKGALLFALIAFLVLAAAAGKGTAELAIAALLPLSLAVALWLSRSRPFVGHFTEEALEIMEPALTIRFEDVQSVRVNGFDYVPNKTKRAFPVDVPHTGGV